MTLKCTASIYSEYFTSTAAIYPGLGLGEKALESRRTNGMSIYCTTTIHCAFIRKETQYESYHRMSFISSIKSKCDIWLALDLHSLYAKLFLEQFGVQNEQTLAQNLTILETTMHF